MAKDRPGYFTVGECEALRDMYRQWRGRPRGGSSFDTGTQSSYLCAFRVVTVENDYLTCKRVDKNGTDYDETFKVAKPYRLQRTPFHGKTITVYGTALTFNYTSASERTVTKSGNAGTENQRIIPAYTPKQGTTYAGDIIYAMAVVGGGSQAVLNKGQANEERIAWVDANLDGRMWAKV